MNDFKLIYKILKHLSDELDLPHSNSAEMCPERFNVNKNRFEQILIMLQKNGYIEGLITNKTVSDDRERIIEPVNVQITLRGLEYLNENSLMERARKLLKEAGEWI